MVKLSLLAFPGVTFMLALLGSATATEQPQCQTIKQIYGSGKNLCEKMWDDSFEYVPVGDPNYDLAYQMWFQGLTNPNEKVTKKRLEQELLPVGYAIEQCHLNYFHKSGPPGPEPDSFRECLPWKQKSCCHQETVVTADKLKEGYGAEYHWDRCGKLSPACERYFVQEACFYECEPASGIFRKYPNATVHPEHPDAFDPAMQDYYDDTKNHNQWQMHKMPIKGDYCDAWFTACEHDLFCASDGGSFFSCAAEYKEVDRVQAAEKKAAEAKARQEAAELDANQREKQSGNLTAGIAAIACITGVALILLVIMVVKERAGKPMFTKLGDGGSSNGCSTAAVPVKAAADSNSKPHVIEEMTSV